MDNKNEKSSNLAKAVIAESLQPKSKSTSDSEGTARKGLLSKSPLTRRVSYRPSHKATFIGVIAVVGILLINVGVVAFIMNSQSQDQTDNDSVTIGPVELENLGVSRNTIGNSGSKLVVGPDATFNGRVTVADAVSIAGNLELNNDLSASSATFQRVQAADIAATQLNINGDTTTSGLGVRQNLGVVGNTTLQGTVNIAQLLTVNNSASIAGNLSVGGALAVNQLRVVSLQTDSSLTVGGHMISQGAAPSVGQGGAIGSNGTVSISGNDTSGTIAINVGAGSSAGTLVTVGFRSAFSNTPHVLITPVGRSAATAYVNRTPSGFTINTSTGLSPGGYVFDYFVIQ